MRAISILATAVKDKTIKQLVEDYQEDVSYPDEDVDDKVGDARAESTGAPHDADAAAAIATRRQMLANFLQAVEALLAERRTNSIH